MAVLQISRIQHRRGLRVDVPVPLNEAEFGWTTDTRELFIGNGPLFSGNTQIITDQTSPGVQPYQYRDRFTYNNILNLTNEVIGNTGFLSAAEGGTPSDELIINTRFSTVRSYQEKFDDWVSIKDYGATGNGETDLNADDTGAFWRAATDLYHEEGNTVEARRRRAIYLPAGVYRIRSWIPLFPFMTMFGDGIGKVIIHFDYAGLTDPLVDQISSVIKTVDSLGQSATDMGVDLLTGDGIASFLPQDIRLSGIEFRSSARQPNNVDNTLMPVTERQIAELRGIKNSRFEYCAFNYVNDVNNPSITAEWSHGDFISDGSSAITMPDTVTASNAMGNISFVECETNGSAFAFNLIDKTVNVNIERHVFGTHFQDVKVGRDSAYDTQRIQLTATGPERVRTTLSRHTDNQDIGFYVTANAGPGNISLANHYSTPAGGHPNHSNDSSGLSTVPAVLFENGINVKHCSSSLDTFDDTIVYDCDGTQVTANTRVRNLATASTVMNAQDFYQLPGAIDLIVCGKLTIIPQSDLGTSSSGVLDIATIPYPSVGALTSGNSIVMDYSMRQAGTGVSSTDLLRVGQFRIIFDEVTPGTASSVSHTDDYTETNDPSINTVVILATPDDLNNQMIIQATFNGSFATPVFKYTLVTVII